MTTPFGAPFPVQPRQSIVSTLIVEPTLGFDTARSPLNIALGATPNSDNYIMREGRLAPRPALSSITGSDGNFPGGFRIAGGQEAVNVSGQHYLMASAQGDSRLPYLSSLAVPWSYASFVGSNEPAINVAHFWDWTQIFHDRSGDNVAVGVPTNRQGMYIWVPGATTYSALTGAPGATCIAPLDNYLLAANLEEAGDTFIQRVRWTDRGSISSWTGGLSGFEDLLSAKGGVNRMLPLENRVAIFFDDEIWTAAPVEFPSVFQFAPLDANIGCPYPWTATITPTGIMFMARNFQLYLLPKSGGVAVPVGLPIHRSIRDAIVQAPRSFGVYDGIRNMYQFYFADSQSSGNVPHRAAWLHLDTGAWAPQSFATGASDIGLTRGFQANLNASRASAWNDMGSITWDQMAGVSWDDMIGIGDERQTVVLGSSGGTLYRLDSTISRDMQATAGPAGQTIRAFWETKLLGDEWPGQQKTIQEVRLDYVAPTTSAVSVRTMQGGTFASGSSTTLPATSAVSQAIAYPFVASRYPAVRIESSDQTNFEIHRLHVTMRVGGR